ncbi:hypothetical protein MiSe_26820 [Microseira wollei NIES-4236]|uniref:Uncharacterized protein n=1 Tax=Microseira wollei NIES-4236 TaxID=2530354 RepID=A0AAV3X6I3_9CYAN|nr:hypothetical protein MiSe_26820 [Microseira wollei NIES-4236]
MGGTLTVRLRVKGESRPQTGQTGSKSCSGKHNPKVSGSNPLPATKLINKKQTLQPLMVTGFCFMLVIGYY